MMRKLGLKSSSSSKKFEPASAANAVSRARSKSASTAASVKSPPSSSAGLYLSAAPPDFERPIIPSETLRELREACALLFREAGPSDDDLEVTLNQPDPLEVYRRDVARIQSLDRPADNSSAAAPNPRQAAAVQPIHIASHRSTSGNRPDPVQPIQPKPQPSTTHSEASEPSKRHVRRGIAPTQLVTSSAALSSEGISQAHKKKPFSVLEPMIEARPKPLTAGGVEPRRMSGWSSASTTRSNTTQENQFSTGMTSVQSPRDDKKTTTSVYARGSSSVSQGTRAKPEGERVLAHNRNAFPASSECVIPTLHPSLPPSRRSLRDPSRSRSRAGSIKDSIIDGIRGYIQPRPSLDHFSRSTSHLPSQVQSRSTSRASSRPSSRGSAASGSSWFRATTSGFRKGSWSSLRSRQFEADDTDSHRQGLKPLDLNRSLPPLPGLDQYKAPKKHIAQLMARSSASKGNFLTDPTILPLQNSHRLRTGEDSEHSSPSNLRIPFSDGTSQNASTRHVFIADRPTTSSGVDGQERQAARARAGHDESSFHRPNKDNCQSDAEPNSREREIRRAVREKMMQCSLGNEEERKYGAADDSRTKLALSSLSTNGTRDDLRYPTQTPSRKTTGNIVAASQKSTPLGPSNLGSPIEGREEHLKPLVSMSEPSQMPSHRSRQKTLRSRWSRFWVAGHADDLAIIAK